MKKIEKISFFKKNADIFILLSVSLICIVFAAFNTFIKFDYRIYDILLGLSPSVKEDEKILIIDIDDASLDDVGVWPWNRDIVADILVRMREFGAYNVVFDIEYLQKSGQALVPSAQQDVEETIARSKSSISDVIGQFATAAASGGYGEQELMSLSDMMVEGYVDPALQEIRAAMGKLSRDNDDYFARSIQFFGNSWMTYNIRMPNDLDDPEKYDGFDAQTDEILAFAKARQYATDRFLLRNVTDKGNYIEKGNDEVYQEQNGYRGFYPARHEFMKFANGAGVTNVVVDRDGTRRRIELLHHPDPTKKFLWKQQDKHLKAYTMDSSLYVPQLAFAPLLSYLDVQSIETKRGSIVLRGAKFPEKKERTDVRIPVDSSTTMYINWSKADYNESFRHISALSFYELEQSEDRIVKNLSNLTRYRIQTLDEHGDTVDLPHYAYAEELVNLHSYITKLKQDMFDLCLGYDEQGNIVGEGISQAYYDAYISNRNDFYEKLKNYIQSEAEYKSFLTQIMDSMRDGESDAQIDEVLAELTSYFEGLSKDYSSFTSFYNKLSTELPNSFCFIGNSATASTDLGVTPFSRSYANLGTHANVANTILQQDFVTPVPVWFGLAFSFACVVIVMSFSRRKSNSRRNITALLYVFIPIVVIILLMVFFKIYTPLFIPAILVILTYLAQLAVNFIAVEKDRSTLRRGFDAYVTPEVVSQIVKDPSKLGLGGVNKNLTALFSDVKTFSGFTEMINNEEGESKGAVRLVSILNEYLGLLSDAIMENKGTIDKYVGDEIVSFFGAPIDDPCNAYNACLAGIKMKLVENEYNKKHFDTDHDIPMRLESRVGLNTGDMVVGNMGTAKKLNYTIMGNNVNLASRLEGTNKVYGSWIMCAESTWNSADSGENKGKLVARSFDCVQVINVKRPVQLYNILGVRSDIPSAQVEAADLFNEGIRLYLNGRDTPDNPKDIEEIKKAFQLFEQAYKCYPEDESSKKFMERCQDYIANGLPDKWDGVYVMKSK